MILWGNKINDDYAWEFVALHKFRDFGDGITFFKKFIKWDRYLADHKPSFTIQLIIFNFNIFEFNIYYIWHRDENGKPEKPDGTSLNI